jgi:hypothetical protein
LKEKNYKAWDHISHYYLRRNSEKRLPKIDQCQIGTDLKLVTISDIMLKEDIGEELNLDSDKNYFYRFYFKEKKIF